VLEPTGAEARRLVCAECGRKSDDQAHGWRASFPSSDDELPLHDDELETWCPECAAREFGESA
jgi:hypothetical protein